jgi:predicted nucleic acid-binding protein
VILLDTSGLLAAIDGSQHQHAEAAAALRQASAPLLLSPFVLAELDYLLATRVGVRAQRAMLNEVARGAYRLETFTGADVGLATVILRRYPNLEIGLADASIVVLAERYDVWDVLTLDHRHFNALRAAGRRRFRLLPSA